MTGSNTPGPFPQRGRGATASSASRLMPGWREGAAPGLGGNSRTPPAREQSRPVGGGRGTARVKKTPASGLARGRAGVPGLGGPCRCSWDRVTEVHALWLQSEPLYHSPAVASTGKLMSRFIISCWEIGTRSSRNSIPGLLRKEEEGWLGTSGCTWALSASTVALALDSCWGRGDS